jgi:hypothetical protein
VRVDLLWGLAALDEGGESHGATMRKWLQEIRKSSLNSSAELVMTNEEPLQSDAKILVWDTSDGSYQCMVSSYNWLYGFDDATASRVGSEAGVRLGDPRLVGSICSTIAGWLGARGKQSDSIALRWRQIGSYLAQRNPSAGQPGGSVVKARILYDESHAQMLREGLVNATQRLLVTSHKINRSATGSSDDFNGKLGWLNRRKPQLGFQCVLIVGRRPKPENWGREDQNRLDALIAGVDGAMRFEDRAHARVMVSDDTAIVSSYNFLSSTHDKRQVGVMFTDATVVNPLWQKLTSIGVAAIGGGG